MATLSELTNMPKLPITSSILSAPKAKTPEGYMGPDEIAPALQEISQEEALAQKRVGEADIAIEQARRTEKGTEAAMRKKLTERLGQEARDLPERERLKQAREEMTNMSFVPTQDTAKDLAGLFSLMNVIGMIAFKGNAQQAMYAMNGMLEGYQKGRGDLYKREKDIFDKNFKSMQAKVNTLEKELAEALELKKYDKEAGEEDITVAIAKAESPLLNAMKNKQGDVAVLEAVKGLKKNLTTVAELNNTLQKAADDRKDRKERLESERAMRAAQMAQTRELALIRAGAKDTKPPPKEIVAQNQLRNSLIPKIEEALPVLDRLNKEGKWNTMTTLLAVDPRAAELQFKDDKEALNLILTLAYFRSKEFETAGKALTRKEDQILAPIVRGDLRAYEGIKNAMEQGVKSLKQEQKGLEATYPFIREYNKAMRGETEAETPSPSAKQMPTGDKLKAYADQHFGGDENAARTYLQSQGYQ